MLKIDRNSRIPDKILVLKATGDQTRLTSIKKAGAIKID